MAKILLVETPPHKTLFKGKKVTKTIEINFSKSLFRTQF